MLQKQSQNCFFKDINIYIYKIQKCASRPNFTQMTNEFVQVISFKESTRLIILNEYHTALIDSLKTFCPFSYLTFGIENTTLVFNFSFILLSHDVASWSDIPPCNKIDKPLVI